MIAADQMKAGKTAVRLIIRRHIGQQPGHIPAGIVISDEINVVFRGIEPDLLHQRLKRKRFAVRISDDKMQSVRIGCAKLGYVVIRSVGGLINKSVVHRRSFLCQASETPV